MELQIYLKKLLNKAKNYSIVNEGSVHFTGEGAPKSKIDDLQNKLKFELPESFKLFLQYFGYYSRIGGGQIYGIQKEFVNFGNENRPIMVRDLNLEDLYNNEKINYKYIDKVVPIYLVGNGDYFAINMHLYDNESKEAPIWYLNHEGFLDENNCEILNPDYTKTPDWYSDRRLEYWLPTKYKNFVEFLEAVVDNNVSTKTF
jgi:hypothetical protein